MGYATVTFLLDAVWVSWMGGWSWGPRFLVPIAALLAVPLAPWLSADRRRWGAVAALGVIGFLVSLPAIIVPSTVQNRLFPGEIGPSVVQQYRLIPDVVSSTLAGRCSGRIKSAPLRECTLAKWQVHVARSVGPLGDLAVVGLTCSLVLLVVVGAKRCASAIRQLETTSGSSDDRRRAATRDPSHPDALPTAGSP